MVSSVLRVLYSCDMQVSLFGYGLFGICDLSSVFYLYR